jgi:hypothetical protein
MRGDDKQHGGERGRDVRDNRSADAELDLQNPRGG